VVRALIAAPLIRRRLRRGTYREVLDALRRRRRPAAPGLGEASDIAVCAEKTIGRMPGTYTCLVRSLVVWWLVGADGTAELRFGVAPPATGETPQFHAWVEVGGTPINDVADVAEHYLPLTSAPRRLQHFD
jgi:hypothetical protein